MHVQYKNVRGDGYIGIPDMKAGDIYGNNCYKKYKSMNSTSLQNMNEFEKNGIKNLNHGFTLYNMIVIWFTTY